MGRWCRRASGSLGRSRYAYADSFGWTFARRMPVASFDGLSCLMLTPAGTDRQNWDLCDLKLGLIPTIEAMQLNAKKCHTKDGSMLVDIELVEVDRGESRLLDRSCCRSRSSGRDGGGHGCQFRKRVRWSQR